MEIRIYRDADFDVLVARWHETNLASFPDIETEQRHTLEDARSFFREKILAGGEVWVAEESRIMQGLIALSGNWIKQLSVFPEFQRRGLGTRLLQQAKDRARSELRLYTLQSNRAARAFYERHGFRAIAFGMSPAPENLPDVQYFWQTDASVAPSLRHDEPEAFATTSIRPEQRKETHMKVGMLGSGAVAQALAEGFLRHGHEVMLGTRAPARLASWAAKNPAARLGSLADAAAFAELAVLAVKGTAAEDALAAAGAANLAGKPVIDATNPIADAPPVNGVLKFFTDLDDSLMERLQRAFVDARFVKAFNSVGNALMVNPQFAGGKPTMFICGNDDAAKKIVSGVLDQFGWETSDMGKAEAARAIEPLCMLWCIPGFLRNEWAHAFKLLS